MGPLIEAIFFDTGNTLRVVEKDALFQNRALAELVRLTGARESPEEFGRVLEQRYQAYKKVAKATQFQASEEELWTRHLLPDTPPGQIAPLAGRLTRLWHDSDGRRVPRPDVRTTLETLHGRGYKLGIIANSISTTEIPDWLASDGLAPLFQAVILSSVVGRRKPDPYIFLEAANAASVPPQACAYVGDNPNRDIQGARAAGFSKVFILLEAETLRKEPLPSHSRPDGILRECRDLLNFFPPRTAP